MKLPGKARVQGAVWLVVLAGVLVFSGCARPASTTQTKTTGTTAVTSTTSAKPSTSTAGPASSVTTTAPKPSTASNAPYGKLTIGASTFAPAGLDPIIANRTAIQYVLAPMFDYLIRTDPPASGSKSVGTVERWEMAPDGLSWTLFIRKGIKFHDGSTLTARDVKFTLDRYASKEANNADLGVAQDHVDVVDDYTVRVFTKGAQPYYWRFINFVPGNQAVVIPKDYFEKVGKEYFSQHPVGTGPFKFVSQVPGDSVTYEALGTHFRQVPAFKTVSIVLVPEEATRVAVLKSGEADAIDMGVDSVASVEKAGLKTASLAGQQAFFEFYGVFDPRAKGMPATDIRVREALSLAIDRDEIGRTIYSGKMIPPMPPIMWPDQPEIDVPYWTAQAAKIYRYDPQAAAQLLKDAGYPQGFTIKLYSYNPGGAPFLPRLGEVVQGYWAKIGVKTQIVPIDWGAFAPMRKSGPNKGPAAELVGQASTQAAAGGIIPTRAISAYFWTQGNFALPGGGIPGLDALFDSAFVELNEAKRMSIVAQILQLSMDSKLLSVIGTVPVMAGLGPSVTIDFPTNNFGIASQAEIAKHK